MRKPRIIEDIISKEDLEDLYINKLLSIEKISIKLNICEDLCRRIIKHYNLKRDSNLVRSKSLLESDSKKKLYLEIKQKITKEIIEKYYIEQDIPYDEIYKKLNIKKSMFDKLCKEYGIKKDRKRAKLNSLGHKYLEYGSKNNYFKSIIEKQMRTRIKNSGSIKESYKKGFEKIRKTNLNKYGVECVFNHPDLCHTFKQYSTPNNYFANLLDSYKIKYTREFNIGLKSFDFKINNNLIEINPSITHNSTYNPYDKKSNYKGLDKNYHLNKTKLARENGYRCINIWDWDDEEKIIKSLQPKQIIYARKCELKEIKNKKEVNSFENLYHFQGKCNKQEICLGLYYNNELIQIMTFGKPRYNKKYEYELLRLCSKFDCYIVGGSERLFKYFIKNYNPESIISYCDLSKFTGNVYLRLGMKLNNISPSLHWYNIKTQKHILDSLLRSKGFDLLLGKEYGYYGKGTSNYELMLKHDFIEIYDAGQATYIWNK